MLVSDLNFYATGKSSSVGSFGYDLFLINIGTGIGNLEQKGKIFESIGILVFWNVDICSQTAYDFVFDYQLKWHCDSSNRVKWQFGAHNFLSAIPVDNCH